MNTLTVAKVTTVILFPCGKRPGLSRFGEYERRTNQGDRDNSRDPRVSPRRAAFPAIELTESQGAAHAYPALLDTNGKKLADGEFRQWIQDDRLRVEIDYEFDDGHHFEENEILRQKPELIQEKWSWKESKTEKSHTNSPQTSGRKRPLLLRTKTTKPNSCRKTLKSSREELLQVLDSRWRFKIYESV